MANNTSILLGDYFERFIAQQIGYSGDADPVPGILTPLLWL